MATPPEIEALKAALLWNNRWAGLCTIAVFAGLIVEYTILLWLKRKELSPVEMTLTIVAGLAIAGGVYGEYQFGSAASDAAIKLESISEQRVADLNKEAGEARKAAGEAIERASRADERAVHLLAEIQPRDLARQQEDKIAEKLRPLAGFDLLIASHWIDAEGARLARQIKFTLNRAGIGSDLNPNFNLIGRYPRIFFGTFGGGEIVIPAIHMGVEVWGSDRNAVRAITDALSSLGKLAVTTPPDSKYPFDLKVRHSIAIFVGVKPFADVK